MLHFFIKIHYTCTCVPKRSYDFYPHRHVYTIVHVILRHVCEGRPAYNNNCCWFEILRGTVRLYLISLFIDRTRLRHIFGCDKISVSVHIKLDSRICLVRSYFTWARGKRGGCREAIVA